MIFRPATPGFLVTLTATVLLAIVSFNVPIIKSVYFLSASISFGGINGTMTIGTLGYCLELSTNGTTCTSPSVGYEFDPNALLGDVPFDIDIPNVIVKWVTYALFLHVIALCGAAISAFFGLLAHIREMSMTCCSTCISGFAAVITLIAFIFDIVLFFVVKKRVEDIDGTAQFGGAVWMTLAAAVLLFISGCVYACGRCMISRRPRSRDPEYAAPNKGGTTGTSPTDVHTEQMRLDAIRAEADRKARQKNEVGLPAFPEHADVVKPLKYMDDDASDGDEPYRDHQPMGAIGAMGAGRMGGPRRQGSGATTATTTTAGPAYRGGYAQAAPGTRAVDEYYSATPSSPARSNSGGTNANMSYPPNRQYSTSPAAAGSAYGSPSPGPGASMGGAAAAVGTGAAVGAAAGYLSADHARFPSGAAYGHRNSDTSYHTAASTPSQHQQYASAYSTYDPYQQQQQQQHQQQSSTASAMPGAYGIGSSTSPPPRQPSQPYADPYSNTTAAQQSTAYGTAIGGADYDYAYGNQDPYSSTSNPYGTSTTTAVGGAVGGFTTKGGSVYQSPTLQPQQPLHQVERSYTLGGGGYGGNAVPDSYGYGTGTGTGYGGGIPTVSSSPPPMPSPAANLHSTATNASSYGQTQTQTQQHPLGSGTGMGMGTGSYDDAPPGYEASAGQGQGQSSNVHVPAWGSKAGLS